MSVANTKIFPKHLDRDIDKIFFDDYLAQESYFDKVAKVRNAPPGGYYKEAELSALGALAKIPEGNPVSYDSPAEGNEVKRIPAKYGLGFQITEEMIKFDVPKNFMRMGSKLAESAAYKRETQFWDLFNNGFATHKAWDANYIFLATHKSLKSRETIANRPSTDAALSETSFQAAFEYFDKAIQSNGRYIRMNPYLLVVPTELRWTATKLWKTDAKVGSADNDLNTVNPQYMKEGWQPLMVPHLTSTTAWFLLAREHDFNFMWWSPYRMESADDFNTGNALYKCTGIFDTFCNNFLGGYGTSGS